MNSGFTLVIPYDQILLLVMGLFMVVGAMRGWFREFVSTSGLVALTVFLIRPALAVPFVLLISRLFRVLARLVAGVPGAEGGTGEVDLPFDVNNPYLLLIAALLIFVLLSYSTAAGAANLTALSRILGGVLGLLNGFLVVSLLKEYAVKYLQRSMTGVAAAGPPSAVSLAVQGLPSEGLLTGRGGTVAIGLLAMMVAVLLLSVVSGRPIGRR